MKYKFSEKVNYQNKEIEFLFIRESGNLSLLSYKVRSLDSMHSFTITFNGTFFELSKITSENSSNLYHNEMEKAINKISTILLENTR